MTIRLRVPGRPQATVAPGMRVRAIWAGNGESYDATVQRTGADGTVIVNWLRPAPLSEEPFTCVCETGGDDTTHRAVPRDNVVMLGEAEALAPWCEDWEAGEAGSASPCALGEDAAPFKLIVHLGEEQVGLLEWLQGEGLPDRVSTFLVANRLKALFWNPLLQHAKGMVSRGQRADAVDIVDLL